MNFSPWLWQCWVDLWGGYIPYTGNWRALAREQRRWDHVFTHALPDLCNPAPADMITPLYTFILACSPCNWENETVSVPWWVAPYSASSTQQQNPSPGDSFHLTTHTASPFPRLSFSLNPHAASSPKTKSGRRCNQIKSLEKKNKTQIKMNITKNNNNDKICY